MAPKIRSGTSSIAPILTTVLTLTATVKMMHWQTKSYAQHKALDDLHDSLTESGDALVESVMGNKASAATHYPQTIDLVQGASVPDTLIKMQSVLQFMRTSLNDPSSESIVDDMINAVRVATYLSNMS